jgi:raffinose/stachyose/melibiose transport system substrate-binding protein
MTKSFTRRATSVALIAATASIALGAGAAQGRTVTAITIADGWGDTPAVAAAFKGVVSNFEKAYPNVTVNLETEGSDAYNESINLKAASSSPPDVFMLSTAGYGPGFYDLAKAGDLEPLNAYAKADKWASRFGNGSLQDFEVNRTTGLLGSGSIYGLPEQNTMLGIFYNKSLLSSLGFSSLPKTMAGFEQTLAAAKAKGITPIAATEDAYVHDEMALWNSYATSATPIDKWVYGVSGTFGSSANTQALNTLVSWQNEGYLQAGSLGVSYASAVSTFTGGQALYFVAGPWEDGTVYQALGAKAGFAKLPSVSSASPIGGGPSSPLVISAKSKHITEDVEFLNFFNSQSQSNYLLAHGFGLPGTSRLPTTAGNPLDKTVAAILSKAEAPSGVGVTPYINWASPTVNNDIYSGLESLIGGQESVTKYVAQIQSDWTTYKSQRH